jgi:hypothetical protein
MALLQEHCDDCLRELGKEYTEVHKWIDELFVKLGPKHRSARHHEGGIKQVIEKFGKEAGKAAEIHIRKDCNGMIPTEQQAQMWSLFGKDGVDFKTSFLSDE